MDMGLPERDASSVIQFDLTSLDAEKSSVQAQHQRRLRFDTQSYCAPSPRLGKKRKPSTTSSSFPTTSYHHPPHSPDQSESVARAVWWLDLAAEPSFESLAHQPRERHQHPDREPNPTQDLTLPYNEPDLEDPSLPSLDALQPLAQQRSEESTNLTNLQSHTIKTSPLRKRDWDTSFNPPRAGTRASSSNTLLSSLTRENLRLFDSLSDAMAQPDKSDKVSKASSKPAFSQRTLLANNNMLIHDDPDLLSHWCPSVYEKAMAILQKTRGSPLKPQIIDKLKDTRKQQRNKNEATFLFHFMMEMLADGRHVPDFDHLPITADQKSWVLGDWKVDGLDFGFQVHMKTNIIPKCISTDKTTSAVLQTLGPVPKPVPDMLFHYKDAVFDQKEIDVNTTFCEYTQVSPNLLHSWLVLECKPPTGDNEEVICQACRGGSAMVMARRHFNQQASPKSIMNRNRPATRSINTLTTPPSSERLEQQKNGDLDSISWSIVLTPDNADVYIHWAELRENDSTLYHMNLLSSHDIKYKLGLASYRTQLFQILDWGLMDRLNEIKAIITSIVRKQQEGIPVKGKVRKEDEICDTDDLPSLQSNADDSYSLPSNAGTPSAKRRRSGLLREGGIGENAAPS